MHPTQSKTVVKIPLITQYFTLSATETINIVSNMYSEKYSKITAAECQ